MILERETTAVAPAVQMQDRCVMLDSYNGHKSDVIRFAMKLSVRRSENKQKKEEIGLHDTQQPIK